MNVTSTRFTPQARTQPPTQPSEATTFTNEPTVPMDAVMRGFSDLEIPSSAKMIAGATVLGAASGALAGAVGGSPWMIPAAIATTAVADTAGIYASSSPGDKRLLYSLALGPIAGGTAGLVGGTIGYGLAALTGMNPVVAGAVAGGATHLAATLVGEFSS